MALDDQEKLKDRERQKLLDEIRRRAEEAELKRIEEEEQRVALATKNLTPPVAPTPEPPTRPSVSRESEKVKDLRERFSIAIDRGKLEKAEELLDELRLLVMDAADLEPLREQVQTLRTQQEESKAKKKAAEQRARETAAQERARRESMEKKISELFEKANSFYQSEKYDRGLASVNEIIALDEGNEEARQLAFNIAKAKELADRIREEEARRRAEEAAVAPPPTPVTPVPQTPGEIWGSKDTTKAPDELGLPEVEEGPALPPKPPVIERLVDRLSRVRIPIKPVLIGAGVIAVAAVAYFVVATLKEAVFPPKYSLLVLPATGATADSTMQFFSEAITEDMINTVSGVSDLRVVALPTALSLRTYTGDLSNAARALGASYYMQWTVSRTDEQVGFQVTLFDTMSSNPVWSTQRQNSVRELQSSLREMGRAVIRAMDVTTAPQEDEAFARVSNTSAAAYESYARGRWYLSQGGPEFINRALASFQSAVGADSLFAQAYLGLAWAHLLAIDDGIGDADTHVQAAWIHLNVALATGDRSSEGYRIRGLIAQHQRQYDRAVEEMERGVAVAASDAETQRRLATAYVIKGRLDDALKAGSRSLSDDPRNAESYTLVGMIHLLRNENTEALDDFADGMRYARDKSAFVGEGYADVLEYNHQSERAVQLLTDRAARTQEYADYYRLGREYQAAGRPKPQWETTLQRAKAVLQNILAENPNDGVAYSYLALVETRLGSFKSALEASARAREVAARNPEVLYNTARMFALQTDKTQALEFLGRAIAVRYQLASILDMDFYNLRSEPEFFSVITH